MLSVKCGLKALGVGARDRSIKREPVSKERSVNKSTLLKFVSSPGRSKRLGRGRSSWRWWTVERFLAQRNKALTWRVPYNEWSLLFTRDKSIVNKTVAGDGTCLVAASVRLTRLPSQFHPLHSLSTAPHSKPPTNFVRWTRALLSCSEL